LHLDFDDRVTKSLAWTVFAGCAYQAGSFADHQSASSGARTTLGCIDLAVSRARDSEAGALIDYFVGNRCAQQVMVDLSRVRVVGRTDAGDDVALTAYDPRAELAPKLLNALWSGRARIEYRGAEPVGSVCVDVGGVEREPSPEHWVCMA
jgi:hypothetical protein